MSVQPLLPIVDHVERTIFTNRTHVGDETKVFAPEVQQASRWCHDSSQACLRSQVKPCLMCGRRTRHRERSMEKMLRMRMDMAGQNTLDVGIPQG